MADGAGSPKQIDHEDIRLRVSDEGPVLEIGEAEILLRTHLELEDHEGPLGRQVPLGGEIDCDGDNGCWFELFPEGGDLFPSISIQPEVKVDGE